MKEKLIPGTKKYARVVEKVAKKMIEENTPKKDNRCKKPRCGGRVVKQCIGLFRGQFSYLPPACEKCKRTYLYATEPIARVGADEFMQSLRRPMTM